MNMVIYGVLIVLCVVLYLMTGLGAMREAILREAVDLICEAESLDMDGPDKMEYVIKRLETLFPRMEFWLTEDGGGAELVQSIYETMRMYAEKRAER